MLPLAYLALAILGSGYIVVAGALGHLSDGGSHAGAEGHAGGSVDYGVDHGGHGQVSAAGPAGAAFHFPFFSPLALATIFASFGGYGLAALFGLKVSDGASLAIAAPAALVTAYAVTYLAHRVIVTSRGSSQIQLAQLIGASGEVTVPIPADGVGEATVMVGAQRFSAPARDIQGRGIPRGTTVTVQRMTGSTMMVARSDDQR